MQPEGCLCVFAKPPEPGKAKTRLIPAVGREGAAALAEAFLQDTWATANLLPWAKAVIASTGPLPPSTGLGSAEIWFQGEGDLGARLERILRRGLERFSFAIALGADSPGLPPHLLEHARIAFREADAVMGPCEDGGFYLLGLRKCPPGLLARIGWSQPDTFAQVFARLRAGGIDVRTLDPWFDVDGPKDLFTLRGQLLSNELGASKTRAVLKYLRLDESAGDSLRISVIIPVLNEREYLPKALANLKSQPWVHEVIVADGGSTDGSREELEKQDIARVIETPRGRGSQMNAAAKMVSGDVLLFVHADCVLPADVGEQIRSQMAASRTVGGCFLVCFPETDRTRLSIVAAGINLRARALGTATGDQAIFVRRQVFEAVGGYQDWPLFEDVDLVGRLRKQGDFRVIRSFVTVSSRRYRQFGVFRTALLFYALRIGFWAGVSPHTLGRCMGDVRSEGTTRV